MSRFDLVDDLGNPAKYDDCPFCDRQLMIGHYQPRGGKPTRALAVVHVTNGKGQTECPTFDRYEDPSDFLELALPRMVARAAVFGARGNA